MHGYHNDYYFIPEIADQLHGAEHVSLSHGDNPTPNVVYTGVLTRQDVHGGALLGLLAQ